MFPAHAQIASSPPPSQRARQMLSRLISTHSHHQVLLVLDRTKLPEKMKMLQLMRQGGCLARMLKKAKSERWARRYSFQSAAAAAGVAETTTMTMAMVQVVRHNLTNISK